MTFPIFFGKIELMFQTTNQKKNTCSLIMHCHILSLLKSPKSCITMHQNYVTTHSTSHTCKKQLWQLVKSPPWAPILLKPQLRTIHWFHWYVRLRVTVSWYHGTSSRRWAKCMAKLYSWGRFTSLKGWFYKMFFELNLGFKHQHGRFCIGGIKHHLKHTDVFWHGHYQVNPYLCLSDS